MFSSIHSLNLPKSLGGMCPHAPLYTRDSPNSSSFLSASPDSIAAKSPGPASHPTTPKTPTSSQQGEIFNFADYKEKMMQMSKSPGAGFSFHSRPMFETIQEVRISLASNTLNKAINALIRVLKGGCQSHLHSHFLLLFIFNQRGEARNLWEVEAI